MQSLCSKGGEVLHQGCLFAHQPRKAQEIGATGGKGTISTNAATAGLNLEAGRELFSLSQRNVAGTESEWSRLVAHYRGSPWRRAGGSRRLKNHLMVIVEVVNYIAAGA